MPKKSRSRRSTPRTRATSGEASRGRISESRDAEPGAGAPPEADKGWRRWSSGWIVAAALLHLLVAGLAASTKSATFDEPIHVLGGMLQWREADFRVNPEHPPLWKYLVGLANVGRPFHADLESPASREMLTDLNRQERWGIKVLFHSPENDGVRLIARARLALLVFGAGVVLLVGIWARQLAGDTAGAVAATVAALDPTLLAHSGLVTNDVACTFVLSVCFFFAWRLTRRLTPLNLIGLCMGCGLAAVTKFTTLALPIYLAPVLLLRAIDRSPWGWTQGRVLTTGSQRLTALALCVLLAGLSGWASIWAAYGFRYRPTSDARLSFDVDYPARLYAFNWSVRHGAGPVDDASRTASQSAVQSWCRLGQQYRLLPQSFLQGLGYAHAMALAGVTFLDGQQIQGGSPSYFIRAWLYKTPLTMLLGVVVAMGVAASRTRQVSLERWVDWGAAGLPYAMVIAVAMLHDLNIGLRHVLPAFPLMWIAMGLAASAIWPGRWGRLWVVSLGAMIGLESLAAYPHYIAYFNPAARGSNHGFDRLSDSNLDWGQDLTLLAAWQQQHPQVPLYLAYFGSADPAAYGLRYINMPPGYLYGPQPQEPDPAQPCVLAFSASWLQGAYLHWLEGTTLDPRAVGRDLETIRREAQPLAVLGGTIYLYEYPLVRKE